MGIGAAWSKLTSGNYSDAFSYLYISDEDIERARTTDLKLKELNQQLADRGVITQEDAYAAAGRIDAGSIDEMLSDPENSPAAGFGQGIEEGAANIRNTVGSVVNTSLSIIPWQVWLIAGIVAAVYIGNAMGLFRKK